MTQPVAFWSKDDKVNLSAGVWAAWTQEPGTTVVPGTGDRQFGAFVEGAEPPVAVHPGEAVPAERVAKLLDDKSDWRLAVTNGDDVEVLSRSRLQDALAQNDDTTVEVKLEFPTPHDKRLLDDAGEYFGPKASLERVKDSINVPIASLGSIATVGGLFGFLAIDDKLQHPGALAITVIFGVGSVVVALYGRYGLGRDEVRFNRIDDIEGRFDSILKGKWLKQSRIALGLFAVAVIAAGFAAYPGAADTTSVAIKVPSFTRNGDELTPHVEVSWADLGDSVAEVRTTVTQGSLQPAATLEKSGDDLKHEIDVKLSASGGDYTVTAEAVDANGQIVGKGYMRTFKPS